jgi:hypothetical protein
MEHIFQLLVRKNKKDLTITHLINIQHVWSWSLLFLPYLIALSIVKNVNIVKNANIPIYHYHLVYFPLGKPARANVFDSAFYPQI